MMRTNFCRLRLILVVFGAAAYSGGVAHADWLYDFSDGNVPDTLHLKAITPSEQPSGSFASTAAPGYLRLYDNLRPPASGGTWMVSGLNDETFSAGLRLSAQINPTGTTNDILGLIGRSAGGTALAPGYGVKFSFKSDENWGRLLVGKMTPSRELLEFSALGPMQPNRSYFLEMMITDLPELGWPVITGRLYDHEGGMVLLERSFADSNLLCPAYMNGRAGVFAYTSGGNLLDVSFDNIRAVSIPEPSTLALLVMGVGGLVICRWRRERPA